jgi:hypothetical protein
MIERKNNHFQDVTKMVQNRKDKRVMHTK